LTFEHLEIPFKILSTAIFELADARIFKPPLAYYLIISHNVLVLPVPGGP
jgi:hypothetical protein